MYIISDFYCMNTVKIFAGFLCSLSKSKILILLACFNLPKIKNSTPGFTFRVIILMNLYRNWDRTWQSNFPSFVSAINWKKNKHQNQSFDGFRSNRCNMKCFAPQTKVWTARGAQIQMRHFRRRLLTNCQPPIEADLWSF